MQMLRKASEHGSCIKTRDRVFKPCSYFSGPYAAPSIERDRAAVVRLVTQRTSDDLLYNWFYFDVRQANMETVGELQNIKNFEAAYCTAETLRDKPK